jgi:hypothetical protein
MVSFRFLHISDLHISSESGRDEPVLTEIKRWKAWLRGEARFKTPPSYSWDIADRLARFVCYYKNVFQVDLDFILATGDLATTGETPDLSAAFKYLNGPILAEWWQDDLTQTASLATVAKRFLLPGNHDRFKGKWYRPGNRLFDSVFDLLWKAKNGVMAVTRTKEKETLGIVLVDLSLRSVLDGTKFRRLYRVGGIWGQGMVYDDTLDTLKAETERLIKDGCHVIWATHFEPNNIVKNLELIGAEKIIKLAEKLKIKHIFCGHLHRLLNSRVQKTSVEIHCVGSATQVTEEYDNSVNSITINIKNKKMEILPPIEHRYNRERDCFI